MEFNVLIVDDEAIVREGLKKFVQWEEMGYRVTHDAESAFRALDIIENERIDVVITDIRMPGMDGLDLIKSINKLNSAVKTIILSGHGLFEYAQQAISLGAYEYIMKPVLFPELNRTLLKLADVIRLENQQKIREIEYVKILNDQFLLQLLHGSYKDNQEIEQKSKEIQLSFLSRQFFVVVIRIVDSNPNESILLLKKSIQETIEDVFHMEESLFVLSSDTLEISVLVNLRFEHCWDRVLLDKLSEIIGGVCPVSFYIGVGAVCDSFMDIHHSYQQAVKVLDYAISGKHGSIVMYDDIQKNSNKNMFSITEEMKKMILSGLTQGEEEQVIQVVDEIFADMQKTTPIRIQSVNDFCAEIILMIRNHIKYFIDTKSFASLEEEALSIQSILQKKDVESIKLHLINSIQTTIHIIRQMKEKTVGMIIERAKLYIREHYNKDIHLNQIAENLYIHPVYFSKLFKDKTGENFIDFLTRLRVEKAMELLQNVSYKIYEISEMVGYGSPKYFSTTFRKHTGVTPKEYRDQLVK